VSLKAQLDNLALHFSGKPNQLATMDEAFHVQQIVEGILAQTL